MFFTTDIFLDIIMLLASNSNPLTKTIINDFISIYDDETKNDVHFGEQEYIKFYVGIIRELLASELTEQDLKICIARLEGSPFARNHKDAFDNLKNLLFPASELTEFQKNHLLDKVQNYILWYHSNKHTRQMFGKLASFNTSTDDNKKEEILNNVKAVANQILDKFHLVKSIKSVPTNTIDFSDKESIKRGLRKHKQNKIAGVFKTGWQGLNRLFGERGGVSRGESVFICALSHHAKSTMLMKFAEWIVNYNTPILPPGSGIPTVLFVSLENEASENMMIMYKSVYESITKKSGLDRSDDEIIEFIYEYFNKRGWKLIMERRLGSEFGYEELKAMYEDLTKNGHCILACIVDYLAKMKRGATVAKEGGHATLQTLITNTVNYFTSKCCTFITAHQLNRTAAELASSGVSNVVRKFGTQHLQEGEAPFKEPDVVIFQHIERNTYGVKYLTFHIAKHRYVNNTPDKDKHTAYRFSQFGIVDDLGGKDMSVKDIYADNYEAEMADSDIVLVAEDGFD